MIPISEGETRPTLVLVSGAPATGKTTLAHQISTALGLPLIPRNDIWNLVVRAFGVRNRDEGRHLLQPMFGLYYSLLSRLLDAGISLVTESNFDPERAEKDLQPLITQSRAVLVHCETPRHISVRRFIARFEAGERDRSAFDHDRIAELSRGEGVEPWFYGETSLRLDVPTLRVDTTSGYSPSLDEIYAFITWLMIDDGTGLLMLATKDVQLAPS